MASHVIILVTVMLMTGFFGGLINFFLHGQRDPDLMNMSRPMVVGIGAAFLMPVVLKLLGSDMIESSQADAWQIMIFASYCLIASIGSGILLSRSSEKVLLIARQAREAVESLEFKVNQLNIQISPLIEAETEHQTQEDDNEGPSISIDELDVTSTNVLKSLGSGRYIFRSLHGMCEDAKLDEATMTKTITLLVTRGLAGKAHTDKGLRWYITDPGRRVMSQIV